MVESEIKNMATAMVALVDAAEAAGNAFAVLLAALDKVEKRCATLQAKKRIDVETMDVRGIVFGIGRDARRLGVSRQYLSRVLHNQAEYEGNKVLNQYRELKRRDAATAPGF